jgi:hypothetical protein
MEPSGRGQAEPQSFHCRSERRNAADMARTDAAALGSHPFALAPWVPLSGPKPARRGEGQRRRVGQCEARVSRVPFEYDGAQLYENEGRPFAVGN